ncbi:MAG: hypothetical protein A2Y33_11580 [Spirochaetes bacterium GWF1_51_8]|nr:MAG: hypothetical protein A2Y33_11580 [Spirochaetes bacterium GWF1_51_8]
MKALILAGGFGTRLVHVVKDVPKPMAPVAGKPFLEYPLFSLKRQGITDIVLLTGHKSEMIESHFGGGSKFGVKISYSVETSPLGTAGAIKRAVDVFGIGMDEQFLVLNGDTWFDIDFALFESFHRNGNRALSIALKYREDVRRYGAVKLRDDSIEGFIEKSPALGDGFINGGIYMMTPAALDGVEDGKAVSFETFVMPRLLEGKSSVGGIPFGGRFIDIGVPDDYYLADRELPRWIERASEKIRAAFLDRDGIIIEDSVYPHLPEHMKLVDGVVPFLKNVSEAGYRPIIVTNQAGIAKGVYGEQAYRAFHGAILDALEREGVGILDTFYCPFHPEAKIKAYRKESLLRKPEPGMILLAADKHFVDVGRSFMVGDKQSDVIRLPYLKSYLLAGKYPLSGNGRVFDSFNTLWEKLNEEQNSPR